MTLVSRLLAAKGQPGSLIKYEWAHRMCHPETCGHLDNYKIILDNDVVGWVSTEQEAEQAVEELRKFLLNNAN